ncbi:hypothetical protein PHLCEN_2v10589 [Hermanssonia centrifuga]|uniref:Uncharacterized protein n=1 Tax=Hermanssonia centrifuga TaxID=98765 RepID=A0A2R6NMT4_9APHY|nr:hypothetical protein PHLCEN_2v10589 [Hermanssonia centrifuga]
MELLYNSAKGENIQTDKTPGQADVSQESRPSFCTPKLHPIKVIARSANVTQA